MDHLLSEQTPAASSPVASASTVPSTPSSTAVTQGVDVVQPHASLADMDIDNNKLVCLKEQIDVFQLEIRVLRSKTDVCQSKIRVYQGAMGILREMVAVFQQQIGLSQDVLGAIDELLGNIDKELTLATEKVGKARHTVENFDKRVGSMTEKLEYVAEELKQRVENIDTERVVPLNNNGK